MTPDEIEHLKHQWDIAKVAAKETAHLEYELKYALRWSLIDLFKTNPKYTCPKCGKSMLEHAYRNIRSDLMYCVKCGNCGFFDERTSTFEQMNTFLNWFEICNREENENE